MSTSITLDMGTRAGAAARVMDTADVLGPHYIGEEEPDTLPIAEALRRLMIARQPRSIQRLRSRAARADALRWRGQDLAAIRYVIALARGGARTVRMVWAE